MFNTNMEACLMPYASIRNLFSFRRVRGR